MPLPRSVAHQVPAMHLSSCLLRHQPLNVERKLSAFLTGFPSWVITLTVFLSSTSSGLAVPLLSLSPTTLNPSSQRRRIGLICFILLRCFLQLYLTHVKSLGLVYFLRDELVTLLPYVNNVETDTSQIRCKESLK